MDVQALEMAKEFLRRTVFDNPYIPHVPTPKQAAFLSLPHHESFYGGAAGGGKSDALLMAALQFCDVPGYSALILRRSFQDLALPGALLDRAHDWLAPTGAVWHDQSKQWEFPVAVGACPTLNFGYLQNERDKYRYQSAEFDCIEFDELTQFTASQYTYMFSRLRKTADSKVPFVRMRSASNPGNEGHEFVKIRFVDPGDPTRPFVPANLRDNPFIDQAGYLRALAQLDPITREQLEKGVWDEPTPEGAYYQRQYDRAVSEGRITALPHTPILPVDTWWDLGIAKGRDSMVVWFTQPDGLNIRAIRAYGCSGEGFPHMAQYLQSLPYIYRTHNAPHDIMVTELGTGKTRYEQAAALGIQFQRVPNIGWAEGVLAARNLFHRIWFDRTLCAIGLRALKNYRKEWDDRGQCWKERPVVDWTNDYADAFRMLAVGYNESVPRQPGSREDHYHSDTREDNISQ